MSYMGKDGQDEIELARLLAENAKLKRGSIKRMGVMETAKSLGVSHVAIIKAEREGRIPKRVNGLFDVELCRVAIIQNSAPKKQRAGRSQQGGSVSTVPSGTGGESENESIAEAARQLEWEKVRALKQKTDKDEGHLVEVVAVNAFVAGMIIKARDELTRVGAELADRLGRESSPPQCMARVDDRISQALPALHEYRPA